MVKKLYKNGTFLYKMNLIAGRNGMNNLVQWVHIIEDDSVISFLHGNELVFTAGILNNRSDWLVDFAKKLHEMKASAFVVNIGPHTKEVPEDVLAYCDQVGLPLFTIPWETKMVDMTRDFCHRIMKNDHRESNLSTLMKNIIFNVGDLEAQVLQMERYGYQRDSRFCFVAMAIRNAGGVSAEEHKDTLKSTAEKVAKNMHDFYISFTYKDFQVFALVNYTDEEIKAFTQDFLAQAGRIQTEWGLHLGVSSNQIGMYNQSKNFEKAISAMDMATRLKEPICFYDMLGVYKLLYATNDKAVLRGFYDDTIGKLEAYDRENDTAYTHLLKTYLENNASLQLVSEKLYIHRNTVTNQLKKIESITGFNPFELEDKVSLLLGLYSKDVL